MSKGDHTLGFSETDGMGVGTIVVSVIASFAVEAVLACRAFPNSMFGLELSTEAATMGEWEGTTGTAGRCLFVVVLRHSVPLEVVTASIFYGRG